MTKFPNIYGRKPSAIVNSEGKAVGTYESRRQARLRRSALAKALGLSIGSLRIVASALQEIMPAPALFRFEPIPLDACDSSLAPRRAHSRSANEPGSKPQGYRRRISTATY